MSRPRFEVESTVFITGRGYVVFAKRLDEREFRINNTTRLDGVAVLGGDIPRALDKNGKPRLNLWGFLVDTEDAGGQFTPGKIVELESRPAPDSEA